MSTITLSSIPDLTAAVGVPRLAAIEHPLGYLLGQPGDAGGPDGGPARDAARAGRDDKAGQCHPSPLRVAGIGTEVECPSAEDAAHQQVPAAAPVAHPQPLLARRSCRTIGASSVLAGRRHPGLLDIYLG